MRKSWKPLVAAVAMVGGVSGVAIADGYEYEPVGKSFAAPAKVFSWTGFYVGGHAAYSWPGVSGFYDRPNPGEISLNGLNVDSSIGGVQIGYNYQIQQFVIGIEGDYDWMSKSDSITRPAGAGAPSTFSAEMENLASVRARLGWAWQNFLAYGTVGWGWADYEFRVSGGASGKKTFNENGVVYGGGLELGLTKSVVVRAEYLRYDVGASSTLLAPPFTDCDGPAECRVTFDDIDVVRAAISFKLY